MTRVRLIAVTAAIAAAALVLVVFGTGAGDDHKGDYKVRAIFNNAFTVIPGEDVKISGVKVGKISALDVTPDNKAAVVLDITEPGFKDFRKDATCTIRPQSLIGERYVECTPTQPREAGQPVPNRDFLMGAFGSLGENRREAMKLAAGFRGDRGERIGQRVLGEVGAPGLGEGDELAP